jgi:hypothetical protein
VLCQMVFQDHVLV